MTLDDLIKKGFVEKIKTNPDEVRVLFKLIQRDIETAGSNLNINVDWAHNIAYNAMIQSCLALVQAYGYRPRGEGKHFKAIEFARAVGGNGSRVSKSFKPAGQYSKSPQ